MIKIISAVLIIIFIFVLIEQCSRFGEFDKCRQDRESNPTLYAMEQQWGDC